VAALTTVTSALTNMTSAISTAVTVASDPTTGKAVMMMMMTLGPAITTIVETENAQATTTVENLSNMT